MSKTRAIYIWIPELAERWGVTTKTIRRWIIKGQIADTGITFPYSRVGRRYGWTQGQVADIEAEMIGGGMLAEAPVAS